MNPESDPTPLPAPDPETGGPWVEFWRGSRGPLILALALTVAHFAWLRFHFAPAIMSPDANGYVVQARLLAEAGRTWFTAESPVQYIGMHWLETAAGVFHSRYPAGLPLLFAAAWKLGGLDAALLVNPLLASATVLLVFFLARRLAGGWPGLIAAAVVASVPVANQHALDGDAHIAAAFFLVAGTLALLRFAAARTMGWGLLAGGLLGIVPTVRYPEAIAGVTIGAWLLWRIRPAWRIWPAVVGATVPIACLLAHNAAAYGAFWRTGYALTNEQTGFGLGYLAIHAVPYLQSLGGQGLALFFAFGTAGLAALATDRRWRAEGVLFAGLVTPLLLVYMAYYFGGPGGGAAAGNLRFLIPTFPFFAVAGAWLLARVVGLQNAAYLLYSGEIISAQRAKELGYVLEVVPDADLMDRAMALAASVSKGGPQATAQSKRLLYQGLTRDPLEHLKDHSATLNGLFKTEDHKEGVMSFIEHRDPVWKNR